MKTQYTYVHRHITPDKITELKPFDIFVFGSNLAGIHGGGAAKLAVDKFGAVMGKGVGFYGQTYAIATKDETIQTLPLEDIEIQIGPFLEFATSRHDLMFFVTEIGCGLAGLTPDQIAPMFFNQKIDIPLNVALPEKFWAFQPSTPNKIVLDEQEVPIDIK